MLKGGNSRKRGHQLYGRRHLLARQPLSDTCKSKRRRRNTVQREDLFWEKPTSTGDAGISRYYAGSGGGRVNRPLDTLQRFLSTIKKPFYMTRYVI